MAVSNGQQANQTTFNNAFVSRTADDNTVGKKDLQNTDPASGPDVINVQREINSNNSFTGRPSGSAHDATPTWTNNDIGTSTDTLKQRAEATTAEFNNSTGHNHDGNPGNGAPISAVNLAQFNRFFAEYQYFEVSPASGSTTDVSSSFTTKTPGGSVSAAGVLTSAPNNRVSIIALSTGTAIEDAGGQRVYGRITESSGVWTLSFFTNEAGTETAHTLASTNIGVFYREVFTQENRPTIPADVAEVGSLDLTADIVDASPTQRGAVSTGSQSFAGRKTFEGGVEIRDDSAAFDVEVAMESTVALTADRKLIVDTQNTNITLSGTNTGDVTLATVGATPNANAASLSGQQITLQPADGSNPGVITAGTQTIGGNKTFTGTVSASNLSGTNTGDVTLATFGSTPSAQGASLSGQVLTLQPANATNPGGVSTGAQTFAGAKTFDDDLIANAELVGAITTNSSLTGANQTLPTPATTVIRLTNSGLTSIEGITDPSSAQFAVIVNATGNTFDVLNDTGTAANRILTGTGSALSLANNASIWVVRDTTSSRWRVVGGSGGGGGSASSTVTLTAAENIGIRQAVSVNSSGQIELSESFEHGTRQIHIGFAQAAATAGNPCTVQVSGVLTGFSSLAAGDTVFLSATTPGGTAQPAQVTGSTNGQLQALAIGTAISATDILIQQPSRYQKDKLLSDFNYNFASLIAQEYADATGAPTAADYWAAYNDGGGTPTIPIDGTGGTPTAGMEVRVEVTSNLPGFRLVKPAANVQGQGYSATFSIPDEARAKVIEISFDYQTTANYANNDLRVWIIGETGAELIQPSVFQLPLTTGSNFGTYRAQFQTLATVSSYRLVFHVAGTGTTAWDCIVQNLKIRRQELNVATVITDWESYTPTFTGFGTPTIGFVRRRRVGSNLQVQGQFTSGTVTAVNASLFLPPGLAIQTDVAGGVPAGIWTRSFTGETNTGRMLVNQSLSTTQIYFGRSQAFSGGTENPIAVATANVVFGSAENISFSFEVPISGWGSSTTVIGAEQSRIVAAKYTRSTPQSIPNAVATAVDFANRIYDTHNAVTTGSGWIFTCPVAGFYKISANIIFDSTTWADGQTAELLVFINGVDRDRIGFYEVNGSQTTFVWPNGDTTISCNAGDTIQVRAFQSRGSATNIAANELYNKITIERIAGPEAIGAGELVQLNASKTSGNHTSTGNWQDVASWTVETDSHAAFNATTGIYTVPVAGAYAVQGAVGFATNTNGVRGAEIIQSGTIRYEAIVPANPLGIFDAATPFCRILRCVAGDTIRIRGFQSSGGNLNYSVNAGYTVLSIARVSS